MEPIWDLWERQAVLAPRLSKAARRPGDCNHGHVRKVAVGEDLPAGRGLALSQDVQPGEVILTLPPQLLVNVKTAAKFFPGAKTLIPTPRFGSWAGYHSLTGSRLESQCADIPTPLTSIQVLSLLLLSWKLWRESRLKADPRWTSEQNQMYSDLDAFASSLPSSFTSHPLMWHLGSISGSETGASRATYYSLLAALPYEAQTPHQESVFNFDKDWSVISCILDTRHDLLPFFLAADTIASTSTTGNDSLKLAYAHAWLSVNTRCLHYPLGLPWHEDNITMAPILDMANHTSVNGRFCTISTGGQSHTSTNKSGTTPTTSRANGFELRAPFPEEQTKPLGLCRGDEIYIQYGARDDAVLLAEYGFHLAHTVPLETRPWTGNPYASISLDSAMLSHLSSFTEAERTWKEDELRKAGYWKDWTVHPFPEAHASWRTLVALRLIAIEAEQQSSATLPSEQSSPSSSSSSNELRKWHLHLAGSIPFLSRSNESTVRALLIQACRSTVGEYRSKLQRLQETRDRRWPAVEVAQREDLQSNYDLVATLLKSGVAIGERVIRATQEEQAQAQEQEQQASSIDQQ